MSTSPSSTYSSSSPGSVRKKREKAIADRTQLPLIRLLLTGGTSYLAEFLIQDLIDLNLNGGINHNRKIELHITYNTQIPTIPEGVESSLIRKHQLNLENEVEVRELISVLKPDAIFHIAAMANVGACHRDRPKAMRINCCTALSDAIKDFCPNCFVAFASTDLVYDGEKPPYRNDPVKAIPGTAYGASKMAMENEILKLRYGFVFRLSNMIGPAYCFSPKGTKFLQFLINSCTERAKIGLRHDEIRSFVSVLDVTFTFIKAIIMHFTLEKTKKSCIYNVGGPYGLSRVDLARHVAEAMNIELFVHKDEATCDSTIAKMPASEHAVWNVYQLSNADNVAATGIQNPRDVTMESYDTEKYFDIEYSSAAAVIRTTLAMLNEDEGGEGNEDPITGS